MSQKPKNEDDFQKALTSELAPFVGQKLGIAISGGSDSRALLELAHEWAGCTGSELAAVTVDHGLRDEARQEATVVAEICAALNIPHDTLRWENWDGRGNLQAEARRARYHLVAEWASCGGVAAVALGHTADDVAETFLMRLTRSAGVDGLARMQRKFLRNRVDFVRPLLDVRRENLRQYLNTRDITWIEDPSNYDTKYERVKMRSALNDLEKLGVGVEKISQVAQNLKESSDALKSYAAKEAEGAISLDVGDILLDLSRFAEMPEEIQRRLIVGSIFWVTNSEFAPRAKATSNVLSQISFGADSTLAGCVFTDEANKIRIFREASAVEGAKNCSGLSEIVWDDRWALSGPFPDSARIEALGENGIQRCSDWRDTGRKRQSLLASPSIWVGSELISAPLAQNHELITARPLRNKEDLLRILLSH